MDELGGMNAEQLKVYAANADKIAVAIEALMKQDGWMIFMALYERRKQEIQEKDDYPSLEDFKADRRALDIVEGIIDSFKGYIQDATEAANTLAGLTSEPPKDRGIMLIEHMEGGTVEG